MLHGRIVEGVVAMDVQTNREIPIACDPTAIDAGHREVHLEAAGHLLRDGAMEVRELPDGYAFRYAAEQYPQVMEFIANERLCCPFFTFVVEVTPSQGPIWLRITGGDGVKAFMQAAFTKA
jgi:hypothetical protein